MGSVSDCQPSTPETRLVTEIIDHVAVTNPDAVWLEYPSSADDYSQGFDAITYRSLASAINSLAWFLNDSIKKERNFPTMAYIGPNDARYAVVAYACIKAGFKVVLFSSPRNGVSAHIDLFNAVDCSILATVEPRPPVVNHILSEHSIQVLSLPTLQELLNAQVTPFPYAKTYAEARCDPFLVIHTSGSTGSPKPVTYTHEMFMRSINGIRLPAPSGYKSMSQLFLNGRFINILPLFHIAGFFCATICSHYFGSTVIIPSPNAPPTSDTLHQLVLHTSAAWATVSPASIESLGRSPKLLGSIANKLERLAFLGGTPSLPLGDIVAKRIKICSLIGSSECGGFAQLIPDEREVVQDLWPYICIHPETNPVYRHFSHNLYELIVMRSPASEPYQPVFGLFPEIREFRTNDLFTAHPTVEGLWRHSGRIDDIIVFSNGEKTNPISFESHVVGHPDVSGALVFGTGRFEAGLLIELAETEDDSNRLGNRDAVVAHIWNRIEEANSLAPAYARIDEAHVCFTSKDKPMTRTAKGTVKRRQTLDSYSDEIDKVYREAEATHGLTGSISVDINDNEQVRRAIRDVFECVTKRRVPTDETDFFTLGTDSLQVIRMSRKLRGVLGLQAIEPPLLYGNPSVVALSAELQRNHKESPEDELERQSSKKKDELQRTLQEYRGKVANLASLVSPRNPCHGLEDQPRHTVLLTGTTGYVGSYILEELTRHPLKPTIYCLNRSQDALKVQISRNRERDSALTTEYPSDRVKFISADFTVNETWGLEESVFRDLQREVTLVIHNAWPVHFGLPVSYFRPSLDGLASLIRFCREADRKPPLLFVSSISSCMNLESERITERLVNDMGAPTSGYGESKLVAENMLAEAAESLDIKTGVVRVGQVSGAAYSPGLWNRRDWLPRLLLSSRYLGVIPDNLGRHEAIDWIPIDVLAKVLVDLAFDIGTRSSFQLYHAVNPNTTTWSTLLPSILRAINDDRAHSLSRSISPVTMAEWVERLRASGSQDLEGNEGETDEQNPALKLLDFFENIFEREYSRTSSWSTEIASGVSTWLRDSRCIQPEWMERWTRDLVRTDHPKYPSSRYSGVLRISSHFGHPRKTAYPVFSPVSALVYILTHREIEMAGAPCSGYRSVAYFVNWAIYARKHRPQDLPVENLTHVLYAFANVRSDSGEVHLTDTWSDTDIHWEGDSWNDSGTNLYGCLKQLNLLKKRNRNLKVLLSVGGWTYSSNFKNPASTPQGRDLFAKSCVELVKNLGFDGIDVDWEYPQNSEEAGHFVQLLSAVRNELDAYTQRLGNCQRLELTVACPAGSQNYQKMDIGGMDRLLDFWNLMAYDYAGSWDSLSGHQANIYPSGDRPASTPFSTVAAVDYYISQGVHPSKIVLGMPLYGRAFENTDGPGTPYQGTGDGTWERGVYDYKKLPLDGTEVCYDANIGASFCFNAQQRRFVTYDTPQVTAAKADFIKQRGLGGVMWWESSADKDGSENLIGTAVACLGGPQALQRQDNCIEYPETKYDNLRNGFPDQ
uniref:chitinase n=1 Tax=Hirsutella thompsonii TaxID=42368 RepID=A0A097F8M4_HIRTH|nr:chitinase [Hirsutella thompsonii]